MNPVEALQEAWKLFRSDSQAETVVAVVIVAVVLGPTISTFLEHYREQ